VVQAVFKLNEGVCRPQAGAEIVPGYHFTGVFNESSKYFERFGRERDFLTVFVELARG
jgi:hypothetical protein